MVFSSNQFLLGLKKFRENVGYVKICEVYYNFKMPEELDTRLESIFDWKSFCLVINKHDNSVHISINGEWVKTNFEVELIQNFKITLDQFIVVGKYFGKMTDLNVWNEALSDKSTKNFSTGVNLSN